MLLLACALFLPAQNRIPNTQPKQMQIYKLGCAAPSNEILKAEYQKSMDDSRELFKLADGLKAEFEKNDPHVVSLATLKESEEIEKLAKRIHGRLNRCW